jgi:5-(carboxyamino)imidazole ribonucleotide synthase
MSTVLGVLGGGQLGNYFVVAAKKMGYSVIVLDPDPHAPAGSQADKHIVAQYSDEQALTELANMCSAVTIEFENPPVASLEFLAQFVEVHPSPSCVAVAQNRKEEKHFCESIGLSVAPYEILETSEDAKRISSAGITRTHLHPRSVPLLMKTSRLGYDGKGQQKISDLADIFPLWQNVNRVPCVVEQVLPLDAEFSVVLARSRNGEIAMFTPTYNVHFDGILNISTATTSPTTIDPQFFRSGEQAAVRIAEALNYVGVLCVEFLISGDKLFVNELAPRPHNSGHWTIDAAATSQFEQQVRALVGLPLGDPTMTHTAVAMVNLLGDRWKNGEPIFHIVQQDSSAHLHLYGKSTAQPRRKMGHITVTGTDALHVTDRAVDLRTAITP